MNGGGALPLAIEDSACDVAGEPELSTLVESTGDVRKLNEAAFEAERLENERHRKRAYRFLAEDPLPYTLAFRVFLDLGMKLLKGISEMHGRAWEMRQCQIELRAIEAKEAGLDPLSLHRRTYAMVEAAKNTLENDFNKKLGLLLGKADLWEMLIPHRAHTRKFLCLLFRMGSRSLCLTEARLSSRHRRDPIAFFRVLSSDDDAQLVADEKLCLRCPAFRTEVVKWRANRSSSSTADMKAVARSHARVMRRHIVRLEALHSAFRRRVHVRGVQTHCESLEEANAEMTLDRVRNQTLFQAHLGSVKSFACEIAGQQDGGAEPADVADASASRCAGAWRLFVRQQTLGLNVKPDFASIARQYKALPLPERQNLKLMGDMARAGRARGASNSFGPTSKQVQRTHRDRVATQAVVVRQDKTNSEQSRIDVVASAVQRATAMPGRSLAEMYKQASLEVRAVRRQERLDKDASERALQDWVTKATDRARSLMRDHFPGSEQIRRHLVAVPDLDDVVLRYQIDPTHICEKAKVLENHNASNMKHMLLADWSAKNRQIDHNSACAISEPSAEERKRMRKPACHEVGICLCDKEGDAIYRMRCSLLRVLRSRVRQNTYERQLLREGFLVACLRGARPGPANDFEAALSEIIGGPTEALDTTLYWHLGFVNLSPVVPTFLPLDATAGSEGGMQAPSRDQEKAVCCKHVFVLHISLAASQSKKRCLVVSHSV